MTHQLAFTLYGGFAAGVFEEIGRYFGFHVMLKRYRTWKAGISYGLGHGGIEAFLLGTVISVESIVFGVLNNSHQLPANIPASTLQQIQTLVHQPGYYYLFGTFERLMAICIQVALSLLVLYSVRERKVIFLFISIILHAMVDFVPGLFQSHVFPLWGVEGFMLIYGVLSILFIKKSHLLFLHQTSIMRSNLNKNYYRRRLMSVGEFSILNKRFNSERTGFYRNQEENEKLLLKSNLSSVERFYLDCGTEEAKNELEISKEFVNSNQSIYDILQNKVSNSKFQIVVGAGHSYKVFRKRIPKCFPTCSRNPIICLTKGVIWTLEYNWVKAASLAKNISTLTRQKPEVLGEYTRNV